MTNAKAELKRRKERARIAQSNFRKRQTKERQDLQAKHDLIKAAVRAVIEELEPGDRPALRSKIMDAARSTGLVPDCIRTGSTEARETETWIRTSLVEIDTIPHNATPSDIGSEKECSIIPTQFDPKSWDITINRTSSNLTNYYPQYTKYTEDIAANNFQHLNVIFTDPYLYLGIIGAPADMLPFLGQGAYSFGGRLTWYVLERAFTAHGQTMELQKQEQVRGHRVYQGPDTVKPAGLGHVGNTPYPAARQGRRSDLNLNDILEKTQSQSARLRLLALISLLEARFQQHRKGYDSDPSGGIPELFVGDSSSTFPVSMLAGRNVLSCTEELQELVKREYAAQKQHAADWLTPTAAEARVRRIVGDEVFAVLSDAARQSWKDKRDGNIQGHRTVKDRDSGLIDGLLDGLYESYKCFGDGPRWNIRVLDGVVLGWAQAMMTHDV